MAVMCGDLNRTLAIAGGWLAIFVTVLFLFIFYTLVNLLAMNAYITGCIYTNANLVSLNSQDSDSDVITYLDFLANSPS
jgi:hypothetical protein